MEESGMEIRSSAFFIGSPIPIQYTCDGDNISPPLQWEDPPAGTQSFALIVEDPDAPHPSFTHWVLYNLPPESRELPENVTVSNLPKDAKQGKNGFEQIGFGGPCPPEGTHRYFFKLFALEQCLDLAADASKEELLKAMEGHILDAAEFMGRYTRQA
jgi:Raf kinase inhibitor-like YbhB/YbcL family protein